MMDEIYGKSDNVIYNRCFDFSLRVIKLSRWLKNQKEFEIASQILKSGTSIGANIAEAQYAQSKLDFISKIQIALKEASETKYWLDLLQASDILDINLFSSINSDIEEILKILTSIIKSSKNNKK